jgi:D-alanyl-D-alanine carboxypeptidase
MLKALTLTLALTVAAPAPTEDHPSTLQRDTDAIRAVGITGVQARSTSPGGRSRTAISGVSDLTTGRPVSPHGYFRIGSTNKTIVATVVLQLTGERRVRLDDPVERWLPGLIRGNGNDGRRITVRQLLQHTSGISDASYPGFDTAAEYYQHRYDVHTPREIVAAAMRHAPDFQPGQGWRYSNTGYAVAGLVIEAVTGRPWYDEVERRIIRPLGLRHTVWPGTRPGLPSPHAHGYTRFAAGEDLVDTTELTDADASGGYISTLADLDAFQRALFDGRLLRKPQLDQMRRSVEVDESTREVWPGARYGLGIFSRPLACGVTAWIPGGDQLGYRTRTAVTADGRHSAAVSMSTQLFDSRDSMIAQENAATRLIDHALCH